jgi:hypothetical protein
MEQAEVLAHFRHKVKQACGIPRTYWPPHKTLRFINCNHSTILGHLHHDSLNFGKSADEGFMRALFTAGVSIIYEAQCAGNPSNLQVSES